MAELLFAGVLILIVWTLWAKHPVLRALARAFTALLTLASGAATIFLFQVGQKAHWASDGPGMLLIMFGIVFCALLALLFGGLFFRSLTHSGAETESS